MKLSISLSVVALSLMIVGCKKGLGEAELGRMGASAPKFASDPKISTLDTFLIGKWTTRSYFDPTFAKQLGLGSLMDEEAPNPNEPIVETYEFKPGGQFTLEMTTHKLNFTGTWAMQNNAIMLDYQTLNGDPVQVARDKFVKAAEVGTQGGIRNELISDWIVTALQKQTTLVVASDTTLLVFSSSQPQEAAEGQIPTNLGGLALERLGPKPQ
jgi:hypothetical protein